MQVAKCPDFDHVSIQNATTVINAGIGGDNSLFSTPLKLRMAAK